MADNPQKTVLPLRNTRIVLNLAGARNNFRVNAASFATIPKPERIQLSFEGIQGSITIEMPLVAFWDLSEALYDRSTSAGHPRRKRS
jgi:hypothetical protein